MNGGTSRGQAHGMKLDALVFIYGFCAPTSISLYVFIIQMKLVNIKKTGSKKESLMHFVVQQHGKKLDLPWEAHCSSWAIFSRAS